MKCGATKNVGFCHCCFGWPVSMHSIWNGARNVCVCARARAECILNKPIIRFESNTIDNWRKLLKLDGFSHYIRTDIFASGKL